MKISLKKSDVNTYDVFLIDCSNPQFLGVFEMMIPENRFYFSAELYNTTYWSEYTMKLIYTALHELNNEIIIKAN